MTYSFNLASAYKSEVVYLVLSSESSGKLAYSALYSALFAVFCSSDTVNLLLFIV